MKIAIHHCGGGFSEQWIAYCVEKGIPYKIVNCFDNDIIKAVSDCDAFMWNHIHFRYPEVLFAKQFLYSLEQAGKKVFPDFSTVWHFDDKVGQKYLLESIGAPLVPSYVFYSKKEAKEWINSATFPKIFKLRGGAGGSNVKLIHTGNDAVRLVNKAFGSGFPVFDRKEYLKERIRKVRDKKESVNSIFKGLKRLVLSTEYARIHGRDKGYVYFQDFLPDNSFDTRIVVIGDKAFGAKRLNRKNDFRASGSGTSIYDKAEIDERCVQIAFNVSNRLNSQSIAFDFLFDRNHNPLITEMSYCFPPEAAGKCQGYWDTELNWHAGKFNFQYWQIENLISTLQKREKN